MWRREPPNDGECGRGSPQLTPTGENFHGMRPLQSDEVEMGQEQDHTVSENLTWNEYDGSNQGDNVSIESYEVGDGALSADDQWTNVEVEQVGGVSHLHDVDKLVLSNLTHSRGVVCSRPLSDAEATAALQRVRVRHREVLDSLFKFLDSRA